jgi:hypothetical protein
MQVSPGQRPGLFRHETMVSVAEFLADLDSIDWFAHAGEPCAHPTVESLQVGWDRYGANMLDIWIEQIQAIEDKAKESIGNDEIDRLFEVTSASIHDRLNDGICRYLDRTYSNDVSQLQRTVDESIVPEVVDQVKRDVAWAAIERALQHSGFFGLLVPIYRAGRWPCSWSGDYPEGRPILL